MTVRVSQHHCGQTLYFLIRVWNPPPLSFTPPPLKKSPIFGPEQTRVAGRDTILVPIVNAAEALKFGKHTNLIRNTVVTRMKRLCKWCLERPICGDRFLPVPLSLHAKIGKFHVLARKRQIAKTPKNTDCPQISSETVFQQK